MFQSLTLTQFTRLISSLLTGYAVANRNSIKHDIFFLCPYPSRMSYPPAPENPCSMSPALIIPADNHRVLLCTRHYTLLYNNLEILPISPLGYTVIKWPSQNLNPGLCLQTLYSQTLYYITSEETATLSKIIFLLSTIVSSLSLLHITF